MQVILLEKNEKLGNLGDIANVKSGYARNYLIPQGKAKPANKADVEAFEIIRAELEAKEALLRQQEEHDELMRSQREHFANLDTGVRARETELDEIRRDLDGREQSLGRGGRFEAAGEVHDVELRIVLLGPELGERIARIGGDDLHGHAVFLLERRDHEVAMGLLVGSAERVDDEGLLCP